VRIVGEAGRGSEDLRRKVRRAAHMLLLRSHAKPGVKGWELKRALGRDYKVVLRLLDEELADIGFRIVAKTPDGRDASEEEYGEATFYVTFREPPDWPEVRGSGWRIDELAALAACVALISAKGGRASREELEDLLKSKLPEWKVPGILTRLIRAGYLSETDEGVEVGWRTRVEIDVEHLLSLLLGSRGASGAR